MTQAPSNFARLTYWPMVLLLLAAALPGQTLAHKNWQGNGLTIDPWWKTAVFYQLDPLSFQDSNGDGFGDLNGVASRLDYLQSLGIDAIVLSPFQLESGSAALWEPNYGSEGDLDHLQREASQRRIRLFVDIPLSRTHSAEETLAAARFWLSRGINGLHLTYDRNENASAVQAERRELLSQLKRLCAGFSGGRILLSESDTAPTRDIPQGKRRHRHADGFRSTAPQQASDLSIDRSLTRISALQSSALQTALLNPAPNTVLVTDTPDLPRSFERFAYGAPESAAKILAAVLLLSRQQPMLYFGQEIGQASAGSALAPMQWGDASGFTSGQAWVEAGPNATSATVALEDNDADSLLNWYRKLTALRHSETALHGGSIARVETGYPEVLAWVRAGDRASVQPILVLCNLSARPLVVSVADSLHRLGLSSIGGIHSIALSVAGMAPSTSPRSITLPPWAVYVGELRQPGLEDSPAPLRRHSR